ncbi:unnamed protein product [Candidula unifasciata]|uniref:Probable tRNA(His) guanylyltransferase n=1 Tax=Candidula unifasciata TaxID=100452 RepID=A0A8S3ZWE1_9EUPU|nr:unnamed protein product [Candidula unifasciata]
MAKSKYEYVRQFEIDDPLLQNCWIVVRVDGKAFQKFTDVHYYMKPNDERGLNLMTKAAQAVMSDCPDIVLAYGQSDEYSFVFHKNCKLYGRRASKILTSVVSLFSSSFTLFWPHFFNVQELKYPPVFEAKVALHPSDTNLRDYLSWRQADCHINNLYNTCLWKLIQERALTPAQAADRLKVVIISVYGILSDKNELKDKDLVHNSSSNPRMNHSTLTKAEKRFSSIILHTDIISNTFWEDYPYILGDKVFK